jgi:hypothetical protein
MLPEQALAGSSQGRQEVLSDLEMGQRRHKNACGKWKWSGIPW